MVEPFEDWLAHDMQGGPATAPDATFIALAGDEVIGYAKFSLSPAAQPTTAHHDLTGVKRAWRGRGVARALKATQIAWAKANGYEELRTPQRRAERADPPPQRGVRLPADGRQDLPERARSRDARTAFAKLAGQLLVSPS